MQGKSGCHSVDAVNAKACERSGYVDIGITGIVRRAGELPCASRVGGMCNVCVGGRE